MPSTPSVYDVHVDAGLTNLSVKYQNDELIGNDLSPELIVKKMSDFYYIYGKEDFKVRDDIRIPGTEAQEIYHTYTTSSYICEAHSLKEKVPDEVKDNADDPLDPEFDATELVTNNILLNREKRIATLARTAGNYGAGMTSSPAVLWSTATTSDPVRDILRIAAKAVHASIFKKPNTIVIPYEVALVLSWHADIRDLVKHTHPDLLMVADGIILPKTLWGMKVLMPGAGENTAAMGQTESLGYIWGKDVIVAYVNPSSGLRKLTFMQTFQWKSREVSKWYEQKIKSTWVQCEEWSTEKMISNVAGYLLTTCIA